MTPARQLSRPPRKGSRRSHSPQRQPSSTACPAGSKSWHADQAELARTRTTCRLARQIEEATGRLSDLRDLASALTGEQDTADTAASSTARSSRRLQDTTGTTLRAAAKAGQALREENAGPRVR